MKPLLFSDVLTPRDVNGSRYWTDGHVELCIGPISAQKRRGLPFTHCDDDNGSPAEGATVSEHITGVEVVRLSASLSFYSV